MVRVHEICVQSVRSERDAIDHRVIRRHERVPAHMRDSSDSGSDGAIRSTSPDIQPRPDVTRYSRPRSAINCMPTQIPKNGFPFLRTVCLKRIDHPGNFIESTPTICEGADARQDDPLGPRNGVGIAGHDDRLALSGSRALPARMPWRLNADCRSRSRQLQRSPLASRLRKQTNDVGW